MLHLTLDFPKEFIHISLVYRRKEAQRLTGPMLTTTAFQPVTVENRARIGAALYNLRHTGIAGNLAHCSSPWL
jgi:hypothetical protein